MEGFTPDHLAAFKRHGVSRVLIAYDRDEAGDREADKLAPQLMAEGMECLRVRFPSGMDANTYALKLTPARQSLGLALRQADPPPTRAMAPLAAVVDVEAPPEAAPDELLIVQGERQWRVRGWKRNMSPEQMRVNLRVRRAGADEGAYVRQAAIELGLPDDAVKADMGHVLLRLESLQDEAIDLPGLCHMRQASPANRRHP